MKKRGILKRKDQKFAWAQEAKKGDEEEEETQTKGKEDKDDPS